MGRTLVAYILIGMILFGGAALIARARHYSHQRVYDRRRRREGIAYKKRMAEKDVSS